MVNIKLQDFTATIHRTSQSNGGKFDLIHVECLIESDQPIPAEDTWFIPNSKPIDPMFKSIFEQNNIVLVPTHNSLMQEKIASVADVLQQAQSENQEETKKDLITLAFISVMSKTTLKPIESTTNTYLLSYDYRLFPIAANTFELKVILPFPGFVIPDNGDQVQLTFIAPIGAVIDEANTRGIDDKQQTVAFEIFKPNNGKKQVVSFKYQTDPTFTVRYHY